jgi:hypothetical protein
MNTGLLALLTISLPFFAASRASSFAVAVAATCFVVFACAIMHEIAVFYDASAQLVGTDDAMGPAARAMQQTFNRRLVAACTAALQGPAGDAHQGRPSERSTENPGEQADTRQSMVGHSHVHPHSIHPHQNLGTAYGD